MVTPEIHHYVSLFLVVSRADCSWLSWPPPHWRLQWPHTSWRCWQGWPRTGHESQQPERSRTDTSPHVRRSAPQSAPTPHRQRGHHPSRRGRRSGIASHSGSTDALQGVSRRRQHLWVCHHERHVHSILKRPEHSHGYDQERLAVKRTGRLRPWPRFVGDELPPMMASPQGPQQVKKFQSA